MYEVADGVFQGVTNFIPMKGKTGVPKLPYVDAQREGILLYAKKG